MSWIGLPLIHFRNTQSTPLIAKLYPIKVNVFNLVDFVGVRLGLSIALLYFHQLPAMKKITAGEKVRIVKIQGLVLIAECLTQERTDP